MGKPEGQERLESFRKQKKDLADSIIQVGLYSAVIIRHQLILDDIHKTGLRRI
jgi:hypothetical protein